MTKTCARTAILGRDCKGGGHVTIGQERCVEAEYERCGGRMSQSADRRDNAGYYARFHPPTLARSGWMACALMERIGPMKDRISACAASLEKASTAPGLVLWSSSSSRYAVRPTPNIPDCPEEDWTETQLLRHSQTSASALAAAINRRRGDVSSHRRRRRLRFIPWRPFPF
jgi:hypothetical protein